MCCAQDDIDRLGTLATDAVRNGSPQHLLDWIKGMERRKNPYLECKEVGLEAEKLKRL
jgi:hypothetical protein